VFVIVVTFPEEVAAIPVWVLQDPLPPQEPPMALASRVASVVVLEALEMQLLGELYS